MHVERSNDCSIIRMNERSFADLCEKDCRPGYVLESGVLVENLTIKEAVEQVRNKFRQCIKDLEAGRKKKVKYFYFGKTYVRQKGPQFFPHVPSSWMVDGICSRYNFHSKKRYGKSGLIVLAVITKDSILEECVQKWYIIDREEYALNLEKRLIQFYGGDSRLKNKSTQPGSKDKRGSPAYVVYMAFAMDGKFKDFPLYEVHAGALECKGKRCWFHLQFIRDGIHSLNSDIIIQWTPHLTSIR